ncbi:phage holin family protein [Pseudenhygromyxa sp. WMMC2535]|uniref:phage holin family protein n=1 Tax=Pseudenhygromyxa sp. WMMC2535 TaxID=2712867 RepID=UPI0015549A7D|nr:phage holin family protein [Pseudenhygromyxa sp. WMMC2535]NVB36320.1 phage holin family protein [Pseudenhygromyxa sp. WMMC2535]
MRCAPQLSLTIASSLVCATLVHPSLTHAQAPAASSEQDGEDPLVEAQALYKEGEIKFQTADYEDALVLWKRAYAILPDGEDTRAIRHALVYNIAEAHSRAYDVTRNPTHLRKAKILLENYRADHRALYGDTPEAIAERAEAEDRLAELERKIAESEAAGEQASPLSEVPSEQGEQAEQAESDQQQPPPPKRPLSPQQQWDAEVEQDPVLGPKWAKGNKRIVGGAVMTGIGGIFAFVSLGIFSVIPELDTGLGSGRAAAWTAGGITGVLATGLLIPGGIFLGQGVGLRKEVKAAKPRPTARLFPITSPHGGGVGWVVRF